MQFRAKAIGIGAAALMVAGAGGVGMARYADGGAFAFYKQAPTLWPDYPRAEAARVDWSYPIDPQVFEPVIETANVRPIDAVFAQAPEEETGPYPSYETLEPAPRAIAQEEPEAEPAPVVQVARGSWSEPAQSEAPDATADAGDAAASEAASAPGVADS